MKINYQKILDQKLEEISRSILGLSADLSSGLEPEPNRTALTAAPKLMLHSCCGPCSSYVLEYLSRFFSITVFYYNPNIYPEAEFEKRAETQSELISKMEEAGRFPNHVDLAVPQYGHKEFLEAAKGLYGEPEGGARCEKCFLLRLEETAKAAKQGNFDYFTTTLSVSPHKNAELLNRLGGEVGERYGISYLYADFKKREGYKRSIELSREFDLYRQDYCGCEFSLRADK